MKGFTLSVKIAMGFTILIVISLILGGIAVKNMTNARDISNVLSQQYVPEVEQSNGLERNSLMTMYSIRGYNYTARAEFLKQGRDYLKEVHKFIAVGEELVQKHPNLVKLKEQLGEAVNAVEKYEEHLQEMVQVNQSIDEARIQLDTNAAIYMKNTGDFLTNQNESAKKEYYSGATPAENTERLTKITLINDIIDVGNAARIDVFKAQADRDPEFLSSALDNLQIAYGKVEEIRKYTRQAADIERLNRIVESANSYGDAIRILQEAYKTFRETAVHLEDAGNIVLGVSQNIAEAGLTNTISLAGDVQTSLSTSSKVMIYGLIAAIVIGIIAALLIIRSITKPITASVRMIFDASSQVVAASDEISTSSSQLADGASEQASSVEEVNATTEEATSVNEQNSENTREADILAKSSNQSANEGNVKIQNLMKSMEGITEASQRIAKIIKTIDEIAFQTNLLALNAAVEAARAGEHGLGFAVVADEVKNLAQRSATAARETADIIEQAIEQIKEGNQIAQDTNEAFQDILDKTKKTSDLISEIAVSIREQTEGMNQISVAMGSIDQITQQNAAGSEEAAAAAEELNAQAVSMISSVEEIAKMVGLELKADQINTGGSSKQKPKMLESKGGSGKKQQAPKKEAKKAKKKDDDPEDVLPLDSDDLHDF
ncbi:methyl-accepting chemotaxis protein [Limisalsivibrio acetivorans]|uniref:methyl-accepting chemotaxis protein n=1 Tax=Limisalsivibrio acetivorans TaxID=1304888 RepID=UPI0003B5A705|nr:methyl-accepting chemotaxis protein [Limisalsivibrio acetivorans]